MIRRVREPRGQSELGGGKFGSPDVTRLRTTSLLGLGAGRLLTGRGLAAREQARRRHRHFEQSRAHFVREARRVGTGGVEARTGVAGLGRRADDAGIDEGRAGRRDRGGDALDRARADRVAIDEDRLAVAGGERVREPPRQRDGATFWRVYKDLGDSSRYVERFIVTSWADYLHQRARATLADQVLEEQVRTFLQDGESVTTQHYIAER